LVVARDEWVYRWRNLQAAEGERESDGSEVAARRGNARGANSHATFDVAAAGNVIMAAGLRGTAKAGEHPSESKVDAPVLDPTKRLVGQTASRYLVLQLRYKEGCSCR
jgi:hypothetical protein